MGDIKKRLAPLGLGLPEILLPSDNVDYSKWSVVACDQFTSDKNYWKQVESLIGSSPSTRNLILPEVYLDETDKESSRDEINRNMKAYLEEGILTSRGLGFVYVERSTPFVKKRKGLVAALDLEEYNFTPGTKSAIRPTEATVLDRLPPRIDVRRKAVLDLPHILVLFDDPDNLVFSVLDEAKADLEKLYDFELMQKGGHISGRVVRSTELLEKLAEAFEALQKCNPLLFAIGDGNHSLASAKEVWKELKASGAPQDHPARYALVELENIHDDGLIFEPIHRVLFHLKDNSFFEGLKSVPGAEYTRVDSFMAMKSGIGKPGVIGVTWKGESYLFTLKGGPDDLEAERLHAYLDPYLDENCTTVDYIHGDEAYLELTALKGNAGVYLPAIDKREFFGLIDRKGSMPRKTFSLGEAEEKRYYLEAAKLIP